MSWVPVFTFGLWNAWILMLYVPLLSPIIKLVDKILGKSEIYKKLRGDVRYQKGERMSSQIYMVIQLILLAYSIFLTLELGTIWFVVGLTIYLVGLAILLAVLIIVASTAGGRPFTRGIFRYSRHPAYFSLFITFVGISVASISWVFFLLSIVSVFLQNSSVIAEERSCLETFGLEYLEYLNSTPRWIGIPKA